MSKPIHPPSSLSKKSLEIETLRGLACLFLVAYHVIGTDATNGMRLSSEYVYWHFFVEILTYVRMPIFAFISGYVYALYSINKEDYPKFYKNKLRRLGFPLLSATTLFLVISNIVGTSYSLPLDESYKAYFFSYGHFWYLHASLIIFLIISIMEYFQLLKTRQAVIGLFLLSLPMSQLAFVFNTEFFSLQGFFYIFPFFLLGMYIKRYKVEFSPQALTTLVFISLTMLTIVGLHIAGWWELPVSIVRERWAMIIMSCFVCVTLLSLGTKNKALAWIGGYSYAIYLYHFAQSGARIFMERAGLIEHLPNFIIFIVCMAAGLLIPIVMEEVFKRNKYLNTLFLGARFKPKVPPKN